jgi:hypothetical protein
MARRVRKEMREAEIEFRPRTIARRGAGPHSRGD